jgi:hypothetical protein
MSGLQESTGGETGGLEITFQVLLPKRLKFCSSPADNNSEYFIIAKKACFWSKKEFTDGGKLNRIQRAGADHRPVFYFKSSGRIDHASLRVDGQK